MGFAHNNGELVLNFLICSSDLGFNRKSSTTTTSGKTGSAGSAPGSISQDESSADVTPERPKPLLWEFDLSLSSAPPFVAKPCNTTAKSVKAVDSHFQSSRRLVSERRKQEGLASLLITGGEIWVRRARKSMLRGCRPTKLVWLYSLAKQRSRRRAILRFVFWFFFWFVTLVPIWQN